MDGRKSDLYRRVIDVVVSAVLGVMVMPVIALAAVGSALSLRAWPFFVQERVGHHGEIFRFVKVRTLPLEVPKYTDKHQLVDQRIPAFCRFLRTFHLDELPQLYLVLTGRMSLVGPRPEMAALHEDLHPSFAAERTAVRPGCTGLWQISHACADLIGESPQFDRFYLAHRTVRFDLWVLGRTLLQMTGVGRLVAIEDVPRWVLPADRDEVVVIDLDLLTAAEPAPVPHAVATAVGR